MPFSVNDEGLSSNYRRAVDPGTNDPFGLKGGYGGGSEFYAKTSDDSNRYGLAGEYMDRQTPGQDARDMQMGGYGKLYDIAMGRTPSAAEMQMRQGLGSAMQQQMGAAKGMRGSHMGAVNAGLQSSLGQTQLAGNQQMAQLRAQEQQGALASLGQGLTGVRSTDIAGQQANDEMVRYFMQLGYTMDEANRAAQMQRMGFAQQQIASDQGQDAAWMNLIGQGITTGGQIAAALI